MYCVWQVVKTPIIISNNLLFSVPFRSSIYFMFFIGRWDRTVEMYWVVSRQYYRSLQLHDPVVHKLRTRISSFALLHTYKWVILTDWRTAVAQRLRCCVTNRKVTGSIPAGVSVIFHWHNPSGRTVALGSSQPLTEMSTRSISWGWKRPVRKADNLTTILCRCHEIREP